MNITVNLADQSQQVMTVQDVTAMFFSNGPIPRSLSFELEARIQRTLKRKVGASEAQVLMREVSLQLWPKTPEPEKIERTTNIVLIRFGERSRGCSGKCHTYQSRGVPKNAEGWEEYVQDIFDRKTVAWWKSFFLHRWKKVERTSNPQRTEYAQVWHTLLKERIQKQAADRRLERQRYAARWRAFYADYWTQQEEAFRKDYIAFWKTELQIRDTVKQLLKPKVTKSAPAYSGDLKQVFVTAAMPDKRKTLTKAPRKRSKVAKAKSSDIVYTARWMKDFMAGRCVDSQGIAYVDYLLELMAPDAIVELLHTQLSNADFRLWAEVAQASGFFVIPALLLLPPKRKRSSAVAMKRHNVLNNKVKDETINRYANPKKRYPLEKPTKVQKEAAAQAPIESPPVTEGDETAPVVLPKVASLSATMNIAALSQNAKENRKLIFG